jgi:hypothetical protein
MKKIVDQLSGASEGESGSSSSSSSPSASAASVSVQSYMFIFLKFISSVIPTIEYDYTMQ